MSIPPRARSIPPPLPSRRSSHSSARWTPVRPEKFGDMLLQTIQTVSYHEDRLGRHSQRIEDNRSKFDAIDKKQDEMTATFAAYQLVVQQQFADLKLQLAVEVAKIRQAVAIGSAIFAALVALGAAAIKYL